MRYHLRSLVLRIAFGRELQGLQIFASKLLSSGGPRGACDYCRQDSQLTETPGPLGLGKIYLCHHCATTCLAAARN